MVNLLYTIGVPMGFVLWTTLVLSVGQYMGSDSRTPTSKTFQDYRKLYESQIDIVTEPDETSRGLATRETDGGFELVRIAAKDGNYYRSSYFTLYENEQETVANRLSEYLCEQARNS